MYKQVVLMETGGYSKKNIENIDTVRDIIKSKEYKAPTEYVGGENQVKPYFDFDPLENDDFDVDTFVNNIKNNIKLLFDLESDEDIRYVSRTYPKNGKTKYSYHFIVDKNRISYYNIPALIEKKGMKEQFKDIDTSVYTKNRGLYPIYSSIKRTSNKDEPYITLPEFKPDNDNTDIRKYLVTYIEEDFKDWDVLFPKKEKPKKQSNNYMFGKALNLSKNICDDDQLGYVRDLVLQCLSYRRSENYDDWIKLGFCLRTIDYRLLDTWDEFSQNGSSYKSGECQDLWNKFSENGKISIGSLKFWAKNDSKVLYEKLNEKSIIPYVDKAVRSDGAHVDVATVVQKMYNDKIFYDIKTKCWYKINEKTNIWFQDDDKGTRIRNVLDNCICKLFMDRTHHWNNLQSSDDELKDELQIEANKEKAKKSLKIASQLKNSGFRDSIMKELKTLFATDDFKKSFLNKKYHLFAFNNCVFDCYTKEFREITPDDYIMKTTKYDFDYDNVSDYYVEKVENIFKDILNTPEKYQYFIDINSLRLFGRNIHQEFYIFTGGGSNGKSLWYALHNHAMGDYCDKLNPETFTKQAKSANQTSELSSVEDCRSCIIEEPNEEEKLINKTLKELSGGTYKARGLYQEAEEKNPQFALIFLCNDIPDLQKSEEAIARRVRVISFDNKYCDSPILSNERVKDVSLTTLFSEDINYAKAYIKILIKNWIDKDLIKNIVTPEEIKESSKKYLDDSNIVKNFIEMYYDKSPNDTDKISTTSIYNDYCCRIGNISNKALVKEMKNLGFGYEKFSGKMYFKNIKHKKEDFLEDD